MEIDDMLDQVITQVEKLKLHAEDIGTEIRSQKDIVRKLNSKAEKARINLQKRDSALQGVLQKYRKTNKLCVDMILLLVLLTLIGIMISILRKKNYI